MVTGADYYLANVANSVDDYYLGRGEAPGQWIGATSAALDLTGVVDSAWFGTCSTARGGGGEDLGIMRRSGRRPGFDLTFSAPKGVSLLWVFGSPEVRDDVLAHDRAIAGVIDHLSAEATYVRRGKDGKDLVRAHGFVAAAFRHRMSRDGDPQLHTHVLIPNVVLGTDGRWSAPDARQLYLWQKAATAMYQSALRAELTPLGVSWSVRRNGLGELSDIPRTVLRAFSKRRVDIEAALEKTGFESQRAAESLHSPLGGTSPGMLSTATCLASGGRQSSPRSPSPTGPGGRGQARSPISPGPSVSARASLRLMRRCPTPSARRFWPSWPESGRWTWPITTSLIRRQLASRPSRCSPRLSPTETPWPRWPELSMPVLARSPGSPGSS